jgi:hypothetical protein
VIWLAELTVKERAGMPPKVTLLTSLKLLPETTTLVPPAVAPVEGDSPETAGVEAAALLTTVRVMLVGLYCNEKR